MWIYIITIVVIAILGIVLQGAKSIKINIRKKIFLISAFTVLIIIASVRTQEIGIDTTQYTRAYGIIGQTAVFNTDNLRYEIGFKYFLKILYDISANPQFLIIITSVIINTIMAIFIYRNSKNVILSTLLYVLLNFYFSYMNIMRQALAVSILLLSFEALKSKKNFVYFFLVGLATLFHSSAILGLLYFLIEKFKYKRSYNKFVIPFLIIIFIFGESAINLIAKFSTELKLYIESEKFGIGNYVGALINCLLTFTIFIFGNKILNTNDELKDNNELKFFEKSLVITMIFSVLTMRATIISRFIEYFFIFSIIWLPNILTLMKKNKDLFTILFIIIFVIYWITIMRFRPEWYGVIPYKTILSI